MKRHFKQNTITVRSLKTAPFSKSPRKSNRPAPQIPPANTLGLQKSRTNHQFTLNKAVPSCPYCGGWIIVEKVMDFYNQQALTKCLNCGRILVNPFLSSTIRHPSPIQPTRFVSSPIKLSSNYFLPFPTNEETQ